MKNLLCLLGIHSWNYHLTYPNSIVKCNKTCNRCDKKMHSVYDMSFGETVWLIGHYW